MSKVSVIMPSLNVADYIEKCVESVLNQSLSDLEIICIDAGSTDGTWEILNEYALKDVRIRIVHSDIKSYGYQINLGIELANGDYVAIVETDDYIHQDMYNCLYNIAKETKADIIKADFDAFVEFQNGKTVFSRYKLFKKNKEYYNKVIKPCEVDELHEHDTAIWKGIYRRDFLIKNNIRLHESSGAAFQDIGFMHQVLSYAQSAYYSDKSFYRYRMDREGSSIHSPKSLGYARQDFKWLIEKKDILNLTPCKRGFFRHMISSVMGEMTNVLQAVDYDTESEYIKPYYNWFEDVIREEASGYFDYFRSEFTDFDLLLNNIEGFADKVRQEEHIKEKKNRYILDNIQNRRVVVFGTGIWGTNVLKILYENNVSDILFSDNNSKLWGTRLNEIEVIDPEKIILQDDYIVIIASKYYSKAIEEQLLELGVREDDIIIY